MIKIQYTCEMSRLIVKNLPNNATESELREMFKVIGTITDIQLKYTSSGKFRQFAFIGYHNENEANEAVKHFHNTHIKTNKISVEVCASLGDASKPKSWSKYAKDSRAYKERHTDEVVKEFKKSTEDKPQNSKIKLLQQMKADPNFEEFLRLNAPNDEHLLYKENDKSCEDVEGESTKSTCKQMSDIEYKQSLVKNNKKKEPKAIPLYTLKLCNLPYNCKKKDIKDFFRSIAPFSIRLPRKIKGICYVAFKTENKLKKAILKDKCFLNGKQISVTRYKDFKNDDDSANPLRNKWKSQEEALKNEEDIAESGRIFMRNLSYTCTEEDIQEQFAKYGPITEINLPIDSTTHKLKGFGFVTYLMPEHAVKAYSELDGTIIHGRMLHLLPGKVKEEGDVAELESTNFKQKKAAKLKAQAGLSYNWNSLFLGHDAVADVIAKSYGTSKEAVLDPHGDSNAAVRLALGETQIVTATRKYLEDEGVQLNAFNNVPTKRSNTVILVKNLPADTELFEIRELFAKHGVIGRIIFPPSGITAIVEFLQPSEARNAFKYLAYSSFKHIPLYLEWAPENSLKPQINIKKDNYESSDKKEKEENSEKEEEANLEKEEEEEEDPEPDTTLFVKNLNFKTTEAALHQHFEGCGKIHYATVAIKKDRNNPSNQLSMGYGFVRFMHKTSANRALKTLQGSILDDKALELKRSERTLQSDVVQTKKLVKVVKQTGTKILVRNVPFQAKYNELFELFKTFGELKALRLPRKMVGHNEHRGFAFVDYFTNADAKKAFETLCQSTHLYGRRLVLEWASTEDQDVDEIRKRTAEHYQNEEQVKSKKSVININNI